MGAEAVKQRGGKSVLTFLTQESHWFPLLKKTTVTCVITGFIVGFIGFMGDSTHVGHCWLHTRLQKRNQGLRKPSFQCEERKILILISWPLPRSDLTMAAKLCQILIWSLTVKSNFTVQNTKASQWVVNLPEQLMGGSSLSYLFCISRNLFLFSQYLSDCMFIYL
jgi:hypothetical protein